MALVKALKTVFVEGSRRKEGAVFNYSGAITSDLELIAPDPDKTPTAPAVAAATAALALSNKELKAQLDAAGIQYAGNASNQVLSELLKEAQTNVAPAASSAPDKSTLI